MEVKRVIYEHYKGKLVTVVGISTRIITTPLSSTRVKKTKETIVIFKPSNQDVGELTHLTVEEFTKQVVHNGILVPCFKEYKHASKSEKTN